MTRVILLVSPQPMFGAALQHLAAGMPRPVRVETVVSISAAAQALARPGFAGAIVDLEFDPGNPLAVFEALRGGDRGLPVLTVWSRPDSNLARALKAGGASGLLAKTDDADTLVTAIEGFLNGELWFPGADGEDTERLDPSLTPKQLAVLGQLALGKGNRAIAQALDIAEPTVRTHLGAIFRTLKVTNRSQAILAFLNEHGAGRGIRNAD